MKEVMDFLKDFWVTLQTFLLASLGGFLFHKLGIFLPWLLGPMIVMMIVRQTDKLESRWPTSLRNIGLIVLGVQIGSSFTKKSIEMMWFDFPLMIFMTCSIVCVSILLSLLFHKISGETFATSILGSLPGGLSQMVLLSEEVKTANATVVTLMQTFRIFVVITIVPFFTTWIPKGSHLNEKMIELSSFSMIHFIVFVFIGTLFFIGMKKVHFPLPELMAPIISMAIVQFITNHPVVEVPSLILILSQIFVGAHLGLQLENVKEKISFKLFTTILLTNFLLIAFCAFISLLLSNIHPSNTFLDFFISAAPGGIAEMSITALETGADLSTVTSFHLFRIFFILLVAAPVVTLVLKKWIKA
ncbi:MAG: AbrB family transcriptional regulator [Paenisporosarcina sp.]